MTVSHEILTIIHLYNSKNIGWVPAWVTHIARRTLISTVRLKGQALYETNTNIGQNTYYLNNQPVALIISNVFCYKTLHVSGIIFAHHQEFYTVNPVLVSFMQVSDDRFQAESGWNCSSILTLLGSGHQKPACNLPVANLQQKTPDDGQRRCLKHVEFYNRIEVG